MAGASRVSCRKTTRSPGTPGSRFVKRCSCCSWTATPTAPRPCPSGVRRARAAGSRDYELLGVAVEGLARVTAGAVADGMRMLDDVSAAIISGEIASRSPLALLATSACDRVRDYDRAAQWCGRIKGSASDGDFASCLRSAGRSTRRSVGLWNGEWNEAERELVAAVDEFNASRPAMSVEGAARLGELRRRCGPPR